MEDREYIIILYDYYGELLSDIQKKYFEEYYFNNLSLSEIGEKAVVKKLKEYEEKLKLYAKDKKLKEIIIDTKDETLKKRLEELL